MEVVNHTTGDKCYMKFEPYSYFGGVPKKITGTINNLDGKTEWVLSGTWDQKMEGSKVIGEAVVKVTNGDHIYQREDLHPLCSG